MRSLRRAAEHSGFRRLAKQQRRELRSRGERELVGPVADHVALDEDAVELVADAEDLALAAHAEGYAVVAPSLDPPRRLRRALAPWTDDAGRVPGFGHPLLCPSVLHGVELERLPDVEGLPAFAPPPDEPWIYDGRVVVRPSD